MRAAAALLVALCLGPDHARPAAAELPRRYLIITAPSKAKILYFQLPKGAGATNTLVSTGLGTPQGLAVDQPRKRLLVADPALKSILQFDLHAAEDGGLSADGKKTIADNCEPRWVTVNAVGDAFMTDEIANKIYRIPYAKQGSFKAGGPSPLETLYDGTTITHVSQPGGIATNNLRLFWTNKLSGSDVGTLVKGNFLVEAPTTLESTIKTMSKTSPKAYGVCVALNNVFYTDPEKKLYGIKEMGGPVVELAQDLVKPRGCAWDGDGTVYVADKGAGTIGSFPSSMDTIHPVSLTQEAAVEDAFGLAVYSGSSGARPELLAAALALAALRSLG